jgi:hypothetical protein
MIYRSQYHHQSLLHPTVVKIDASLPVAVARNEEEDDVRVN